MRFKHFALFTVVTLICSGCFSAISGVTSAVNMYRNTRAVTGGVYAAKMAKSLRNAEPIFEGYDSAKVDVQIVPRDSAEAQKIVNAFKDNMDYMIQKDFEEIKTGKQICTAEPCQGKTITIQFKENGYDENLLQRISLGDKLRGKLLYVDAQTKQTIKEEDIESMETYADILHMINTSVAMKLMKSLKDSDSISQAADKVNDMDPIKPEYKQILRQG